MHIRHILSVFVGVVGVVCVVGVVFSHTRCAVATEDEVKLLRHLAKWATDWQMLFNVIYTLLQQRNNQKLRNDIVLSIRVTIRTPQEASVRLV